MDNQNNQNSANNLNNPSSLSGWPPPSPPVVPAPLWPSSPVQPVPSPASSDPGNPVLPLSPQTKEPAPAWTPPVTPPIPAPAAEAPAPSANSWDVPNNTSPWPAAPSIASSYQDTIPPTPIPDTAEPAVPNPPSDTVFSQDQTSTWAPPAQPPTPQSDLPAPSVAPDWSQPTPTFTPPLPIPSQSSDEPKPGMSALDNPWGSSVQPPAIDGSNSTIQPSWTTNVSSPVEAAPTDLSHLISNNNSSPVTTQTAPETLVAPSAPTPEVPTLPIQNHKGIPRWLIGLGAGLLILVIGASVYFILGVGQGDKTTTSLPATIAPKTNEVVSSGRTAAPVAQSPSPAATNSASFGQLEGSSGNTQATSAAELLRQRQQTGK